MSHDATKVQLGTTRSSLRQGTKTYASDPATYKAGLAVRVASTGLLTLVKASGLWAGISLGKSLDDAAKTTVLPVGLQVPVLLKSKKASGTVVITSYANLVSGTPDTVTVNGQAFTAQAGAATPGQATFQAATNNNTTAASLAAQINAHAVIGALVTAKVSNATVTIYAEAGGTAGNAITLAYADNGTSTVGATVSGATLTGGAAAPDYVVLGAKVYFNDATGEADSSDADSTVSDAVYASGVLTGIDEAGNEVYAAVVDMVGGL